ncbi:dihydropteroate synthase [Candidatus Acetothermia bacterium]|nr:dihydropteroate synthase [Candidatus Acetothermia bacterium]
MTDVLSKIGHQTLVMGILNVTPDSFSDGGQFLEFEKAAEHAQRLIRDGADILDIGGESTRPGSERVSLDEELRRVIPVIKLIRQVSKIPISIDTYRSQIAKAALNAGADIINDISALRFDERMKDLVSEAKVPVVLMHMLGEPKTMQQNPIYRDVMGEIIQFLRERIDVAVRAGIEERKIWVDPGIGFGKKVEHNIEILQRLRELKILKKPILIGISRKFFLGALASDPPLLPQDRLEGTIASNVISVMNGADIVRVHDVQATKRALRIVDAVVRGTEAAKSD